MAAGIGESKQDVGMTKVDHIELGGIVIRDQVFATLDLTDFAGRGEGLDDVAGLLGYELLRRFPVTIDYQHSRAIFYNPETFKYTGKGLRVPFRFRVRFRRSMARWTVSQAHLSSTPAVGRPSIWPRRSSTRTASRRNMHRSIASSPKQASADTRIRRSRAPAA